jgi:hypothetical protein
MRIHRVTPSTVILSYLLVVALVVSCRHAPPNTTPQAAVAHYGTDVVAGVKEIQGAVIAATDATPPMLTVQQATPIMNTVRTALDRASDLSAALKAYDAASSIADKQNLSGRIEGLVQAITTAMSRLATGAGAPPQLAQQLAGLASNVTGTLATIKTALALHPSSPPPEIPAGAVVAFVMGGVR